MKKIITLTESDLKRLVKRILDEQATSYQVGQPAGQAAAQATKQVVGQAAQAVGQAAATGAQAVMKAGKQTIVTLGNVTFTIVIYQAAVVWLIGKGIYRMAKATSDALLKLLATTGKLVVGGATTLGQATLNTLKAGGIAIEKGVQAVGQQLSKLGDSTINVGKWIIGKTKQFGTKVYAAVLGGASKIGALAGAFGEFLKQQWGTIQNQVGKTWDQAKSMAAGAYQAASKAAQNVGSQVSKAASSVGSSISKAAGNVTGFLGGLMSEMFERYFSFEGSSTLDIIYEARKFNGKSILL
jgi:hypothetical protein